MTALGWVVVVLVASGLVVAAVAAARSVRPKDERAVSAQRKEQHRKRPRLRGMSPGQIIFWIALLLLALSFFCWIFFVSRGCYLTCSVDGAASDSCEGRQCEDWEWNLFGSSVLLFAASIATFLLALIVGVAVAIWRRYRPR